ncbi:biopolymer transporter ExbD [Luteolibacter sp. SL250]|uniref:ExbD/TolR family protein n=1 Tax=Luteolibacter sp. SL250 TaxID=2995170 RepID=UPI0022719B23|nr:biopolymer transporter ExbD [Luteolibacter sp. SL250]WAC17969.1 biopolymer transporter ExbD [Luteolibacter sp. SL250]
MPVKLQGGASGEEEEARIEVVPLIDIMFFLLASFMMVSISMTQLNRVPLKLPTVSNSQPEIKAPPIHLAIDANGVISWDTAVVTATEITDRLKALPPTDDTAVMIGADEEAKHKQVMAVLDAVKSAGISKVSFETQKPN